MLKPDSYSYSIMQLPQLGEIEKILGYRNFSVYLSPESMFFPCNKSKHLSVKLYFDLQEVHCIHSQDEPGIKTAPVCLFMLYLPSVNSDPLSLCIVGQKVNTSTNQNKSIPSYLKVKKKTNTNIYKLKLNGEYLPSIYCDGDIIHMKSQYRLNSENCRVFQINFQKNELEIQIYGHKFTVGCYMFLQDFVPGVPPHIPSEFLEGTLSVKFQCLHIFLLRESNEFVVTFTACIMYSMRTKMMASSSLIMIMTLFPLLIINFPSHAYVCFLTSVCGN